MLAYEGVHRERQKAIAGQLFEAMDIEWSDTARRNDWVLLGFRQFDAPASIVVTFDKTLENNDIAIFDCAAIGYPLDDLPADDVISTRRDVDEVVSFVGYE